MMNMKKAMRGISLLLCLGFFAFTNVSSAWARIMCEDVMDGIKNWVSDPQSGFSGDVEISCDDATGKVTMKYNGKTATRPISGVFSILQAGGYTNIIPNGDNEDPRQGGSYSNKIHLNENNNSNTNSQANGSGTPCQQDAARQRAELNQAKIDAGYDGDDILIQCVDNKVVFVYAGTNYDTAAAAVAAAMAAKQQDPLQANTDNSELQGDGQGGQGGNGTGTGTGDGTGTNGKAEALGKKPCPTLSSLGGSTSTKNTSGQNVTVNLTIFDYLACRIMEVLVKVRLLVYILAGFGMIAFAYGAIIGKISFKQLGNIGIGLFILSMTTGIIEYITGGTRELWYGDRLEDTGYAATGEGVAKSSSGKNIKCTTNERGESVCTADTPAQASAGDTPDGEAGGKSKWGLGDYLNSANSALDAVGTALDTFDKVTNAIDTISDAWGDLSDALSGTNDNVRNAEANLEAAQENLAEAQKEQAEANDYYAEVKKARQEYLYGSGECFAHEKCKKMNEETGYCEEYDTTSKCIDCDGELQEDGSCKTTGYNADGTCNGKEVALKATEAQIINGKAYTCPTRFKKNTNKETKKTQPYVCDGQDPVEDNTLKINEKGKVMICALGGSYGEQAKLAKEKQYLKEMKALEKAIKSGNFDALPDEIYEKYEDQINAVLEEKERLQALEDIQNIDQLTKQAVAACAKSDAYKEKMNKLNPNRYTDRQKLEKMQGQMDKLQDKCNEMAGRLEAAQTALDELNNSPEIQEALAAAELAYAELGQEEAALEGMLEAFNEGDYSSLVGEETKQKLTDQQAALDKAQEELEAISQAIQSGNYDGLVDEETNKKLKEQQAKLEENKAKLALLQDAQNLDKLKASADKADQKVADLEAQLAQLDPENHPSQRAAYEALQQKLAAAKEEAESIHGKISNVEAELEKNPDMNLQEEIEKLKLSVADGEYILNETQEAAKAQIEAALNAKKEEVANAQDALNATQSAAQAEAEATIRAQQEKVAEAEAKADETAAAYEDAQAAMRDSISNAIADSQSRLAEAQDGLNEAFAQDVSDMEEYVNAHDEQVKQLKAGAKIVESEYNSATKDCDRADKAVATAEKVVGQCEKNLEKAKETVGNFLDRAAKVAQSADRIMKTVNNTAQTVAKNASRIANDIQDVGRNAEQREKVAQSRKEYTKLKKQCGDKCDGCSGDTKTQCEKAKKDSKYSFVDKGLNSKAGKTVFNTLNNAAKGTSIARNTTSAARGAYNKYKRKGDKYDKSGSLGNVLGVIGAVSKGGTTGLTQTTKAFGSGSKNKNKTSNKKQKNKKNL